MTFTKEFKEAIQNLPSAEKDKLILRLLKKDLVLANQLLFQLVDTDSVDQKRDFVEKELTRYLNKSIVRYYSIGIFLMEMRFCSGKINDHVRITKDKVGEISLNIQLLTESIQHIKLYILNTKPRDNYTTCIYIIARTFKILLLIKAQHEDLHLEYRKTVIKLGQLIGENDVLMQYAIHNGLDVNWLLRYEIPDNIVAIHKEIRANGLLK